MKTKSILFLSLAALTIGAAWANASGISYTCDPTVSAATCAYLNTTVAGLYGSTFSNATADIYITYWHDGFRPEFSIPELRELQHVCQRAYGGKWTRHRSDRCRCEFTRL
jgi:hypothetical protein